MSVSRDVEATVRPDNDELLPAEAGLAQRDRQFAGKYKTTRPTAARLFLSFIIPV